MLTLCVLTILTVGGGLCQQVQPGGSAACTNFHSMCSVWAQRGDCSRDVDYMLKTCPGSCSPSCATPAPLLGQGQVPGQVQGQVQGPILFSSSGTDQGGGQVPPVPGPAQVQGQVPFPNPGPTSLIFANPEVARMEGNTNLIVPGPQAPQGPLQALQGQPQVLQGLQGPPQTVQVPPQRPQGSQGAKYACVDLQDACSIWAGNGECELYHAFMYRICTKSCDPACKNTVPPTQATVAPAPAPAPAPVQPSAPQNSQYPVLSPGVIYSQQPQPVAPVQPFYYARAQAGLIAPVQPVPAQPRPARPAGPVGPPNVQIAPIAAQPAPTNPQPGTFVPGTLVQTQPSPLTGVIAQGTEVQSGNVLPNQDQTGQTSAINGDVYIVSGSGVYEPIHGTGASQQDQIPTGAPTVTGSDVGQQVPQIGPEAVVPQNGQGLPQVELPQSMILVPPNNQQFGGNVPTGARIPAPPVQPSAEAAAPNGVLPSIEAVPTSQPSIPVNVGPVGPAPVNPVPATVPRVIQPPAFGPNTGPQGAAAGQVPAAVAGQVPAAVAGQFPAASTGQVGPSPSLPSGVNLRCVNRRDNCNYLVSVDTCNGPGMWWLCAQSCHPGCTGQSGQPPYVGGIGGSSRPLVSGRSAQTVPGPDGQLTLTGGSR